ncbi:MAG: HAD-IIA family hydrolase [Erysipelotrichaceae bacterium]
MYLIDLDGTLYSGHQRIDGALEFIQYLQETKQAFVFLTNNASRTKKQNVEHLESLGFTGIKEEHFFTSAMAAAQYVAQTYEARRAFYLGMDGLEEALLASGFTLVQEQADFVFVGLDKMGTYSKYSQALENLMSGAILVGTNHDRKLPYNNTYHIGNGAIVTMLEYASGQSSLKIGKPYPTILQMACNYYKVKKEDMVMIGDNLETDILLGVHAEIDTIFVTTGVHTSEDCSRLQILPTRTISTLKELIVEK